MKTVKIKVHAKINLTLEIVGIKDGYHMLDSLVASLDMFDLVLLKKRKDKLSAVTMKGLDSDKIPVDNNALKAAEAFSKRFDVTGAEITVHRNIPMGAGLGGSSADIAGVLNGMAKLYGIDDRKAVEQLAEELGSDSKYMLTGGFARMQGRGELLTPLSVHTPLHFLLICPQSTVSAGACYKEYDALVEGRAEKTKDVTENCIRLLQENGVNEVGRYLMNDLFAPAVRLNPDILTAYEEAKSFSPLGVVMTGSGSCVLALFESKELCEWAKSRYKGKFKTYVAKTVIPNGEKDKGSIRNPFALTAEELSGYTDGE